MPARRTRGKQARRRSPWPWLITAGVIAAFVLMVVLVTRQPRQGPRVGDHWHAAYRIELCGETLPPLPPSPGDVHTHGDGIIHLHPTTAATSGRRATLEAFFRTTQVRITESSIAVPGRPTYSNGGTCPDGKVGRLRVLVQKAGEGEFVEVPGFLSYLPHDGDVIRIVFGP